MLDEIGRSWMMDGYGWTDRYWMMDGYEIGWILDDGWMDG